MLSGQTPPPADTLAHTAGKTACKEEIEVDGADGSALPCVNVLLASSHVDLGH